MPGKGGRQASPYLVDFAVTTRSTELELMGGLAYGVVAVAFLAFRGGSSPDTSEPATGNRDGLHVPVGLRRTVVAKQPGHATRCGGG